MPIDTETGAVFNEEDKEAYMQKKAQGVFTKPPKGKVYVEGKEVAL